MTPVLSENNEEAVSKFHKLLAEKGAEVVLKTTGDYVNWLSHTRKKSTGFYYLDRIQSRQQCG